MSDYRQPEFYRFNEDSIKLVNYVEEKEARIDGKVLDACCGCGVLGVELSTRINIHSVDFVDVQKEYEEFINWNIDNIYQGTLSRVIIDDIRTLSSEYDLILLNPPYYCESSHRPSPNKNRNIARLYKASELEEIYTHCISLLSNKGKLYSVMKESEVSKLNDLIKKFQGEVERFGKICFITFSSVEDK